MEEYNTKEKAYEYAKQFKSRTEISKKDYKFYRFILKNKWIDEMLWLNKIRKWTYEATYNEALKYQCKKDFEKGSAGAYSAALKHQWMNDYVWLKKDYKKYSYEFCYNIAKQCNSSKEMNDLCKGAYVAAVRRGWKNDYTWFKRKILVSVNQIDRIYFIYAYFDEINKFVYIGLTHTNKRDKQHRQKTKYNNDSVYEYFKNKNLKIPQWEILESNLTAVEATIKEGEWLDFYIKNGWRAINKTKTGSLGARKIIWTENKILEEAKKYEKKYDFYKKSPGAYAAALRLNIINKIQWSNPPFRWTKEKAIEEAKKYKNRKDLCNKKNGLYNFLNKNKLLDNVFPIVIMTKEKAIEISKQFVFLKDFREKEKTLYRLCQTKKWLNEFTWLKRKNMKQMTDEECLEISKKYNIKNDFMKHASKAYNYAKNNNLLKKMTWLKNKNGNIKKMTNEECFQESRKYKTTKEFKEKSYKAYRYAIRYKLLQNMYWLTNKK